MKYPPETTLMGLPPQVRGTQRRHTLRRGLVGAYPRRCGEHSPVHELIGRVAGLPPQVRGTQLSIELSNSLSWLTPAGAGNTVLDGSWDMIIGAYPRRCGEHAQESHAEWRTRGLPPQVRGTRLLSYGY